jgi:hypothetical protein
MPVALEGDDGECRSAETVVMILAPRHRSVVIVAFAVSLFLGMALTPPPGEGAAELLDSLHHHQVLANLTGLFRTVAAILVVPALAAIAPAVTERSTRLFSLAVAFLYVGSLAGIVLFTQMIFQNTVLTSLPDQLMALQIAEAIQASLLWQIPAIPYLVGLLVGFLLLGLAVWRAGLGRLMGVAIAGGLLLHIAGGDWFVTALAGALVLCGGLTALGLRIADSPRAQTQQDPATNLVSGGSRPTDQ